MGYDAGKKVKGRKLHALVDVLGMPLRLLVHPASVQDRDGAALVLDKIRQRFPWLELVWADGGYNANQVKDAAAKSPGTYSLGFCGVALAAARTRWSASAITGAPTSAIAGRATIG